MVVSGLAPPDGSPLGGVQHPTFWADRVVRRGIKEFVLVKEVGSGAASTVYYALCRKSTKPVAIKMYLKSKLSKLNRKQVIRAQGCHRDAGEAARRAFAVAYR